MLCLKWCRSCVLICLYVVVRLDRVLFNRFLLIIYLYRVGVLFKINVSIKGICLRWENLYCDLKCDLGDFWGFVLIYFRLKNKILEIFFFVGL